MQKKPWMVAAALTGAALIAWLWFGRRPTEAEDSARSAAGDATPAAVAPVERNDLDNTLRIAGEFKPFQEVDVHAKVAGYIRKIYVDVGDRVKQGQTIAILEVPELTAQLAGADAAVHRAEEEIHKAQSDVQRARSAHSASHSAYSRLKQAADSRAGLVAQQELDDSQAKDLEAEAQVASTEAELSAARQQFEMAQANQRQFAALSGYSRIVAPFAGVITQRYADNGALIQAGTASNTQAMPVVRLAETDKLRLVLPIPESAASEIHTGDSVKVHVGAISQDIKGKVSRFADSLDRQTRTMETEIDCENHDGHLIAGMYAETSVSLRQRKGVLTVPLEAVARNGEDATVLAVNGRNEIEERHIKLGLEDNSRVEVLSGLKENEQVVIGNRTEFRKGQKITPKEAAPSAQKAPGAN